MDETTRRLPVTGVRQAREADMDETTKILPVGLQG